MMRRIGHHFVTIILLNLSVPITTSVPIKRFDQPSFHAVDEVVTGIAFDVHNEFGRYLDERPYKTELHRRFAACGFQSVREMKITLSLDDFAKDYFVDFLINAGVILETNPVEVIASALNLLPV